MSSVVATKLFVPRPRPGHVPREHLRQRIQRGLLGPMTLVCAPAGFGKTTLASSALQGGDMPVSWLSLDEQDGDLKRFIAGVCAAVAKNVAGFGEATRALLDSPQAQSDGLLVTLLNELAELPQDLVLVLDDYHAVDASDVDEALAFLVEHQPPTLHWLITSREDPALPLPRLRARGELTEVRAADLRFSLQEAKQFFADTMGLTLDDDQITALEQRTEGWIAGLQLAALSLQGRDDSAEFIENFAGTHRFVIDYLAEEVLARQDEATRLFLIQCAILPRFCASLCQAVTQQNDAAERLLRLEKQNLFLIPLDQERHWYRFHHLFADVLLARLQHSAEDTARLHQRAADWFWEQQNIADALHHSIQAGQPEQAAQWLELTWPEMRSSEPETVFMQWTKQLPEAYLTQSPVLCGHLGLTLLSYDIPAALSWLERTEQWLQQTPEQVLGAGGVIHNTKAWQQLPALLSIGKAYSAGAQGDMAGVIAHAQQALDQLDETELMWRASAAIFMGLVQWSGGQLASAASDLQPGYDEMLRANELSGAVSVAFLWANVHMGQGRYAQAKRICTKALGLIDGCHFAPQGSADVYVTLAVLELGQMNVQEAHEQLARAEALGEQAKLLESAHLGLVVQGILAALKQDWDNAIDLLDEAINVRRPSPSPEFAPIEAWQARLQLVSGRQPEAEHWAQQSGLGLSDDVMYVLEFSHLTMVHVVLARHRESDETTELDDALGLLERLDKLATAELRDASLVEIRLLRALLLRARSHESEAVQALKHAIELPQAQWQQHLFALLPSPDRNWIQQVSRKPEQPAWLRSLFAPDSEAPGKTQTSQRVEALLDPLSDREMEVLRALHSEMSGPEIAASLFVSLNTLRTHTKNIYCKLGVNTRRAALRRAEELGIQ